MTCYSFETGLTCAGHFLCKFHQQRDICEPIVHRLVVIRVLQARIWEQKWKQEGTDTDTWSLQWCVHATWSLFIGHWSVSDHVSLRVKLSEIFCITLMNFNTPWTTEQQVPQLSNWPFLEEHEADCTLMRWSDDLQVSYMYKLLVSCYVVLCVYYCVFGVVIAVFYISCTFCVALCKKLPYLEQVQWVRDRQLACDTSLVNHWTHVLVNSVCD